MVWYSLNGLRSSLVHNKSQKNVRRIVFQQIGFKDIFERINPQIILKADFSNK